MKNATAAIVHTNTSISTSVQFTNVTDRMARVFLKKSKLGGQQCIC